MPTIVLCTKTKPGNIRWAQPALQLKEYMKNICRDITIRSVKSIFDLITRIALFIIIISPFLFLESPYSGNLLKGNLFLSSTGFHIPDLLADSLFISLKLIVCSLVISGYFGLVVSLVGAFGQQYYWLPSLFVIISTIPIFITSYYLPYILFFIFLVTILLSVSSSTGKSLTPLALLAVLFVLVLTTISYAGKTGYLDIIIQSKPTYMPLWIWEDFSSISLASIFFTENILPIVTPILIGLIFLIYYRKHPLNTSLVIALFVGALSVYGIIVYGYRTQVEDTYLLGPILTLAIGNLVLGLFINQIQEGIAEELQFDYIKAAVAKGASLWNHLRIKIFLIVLNTLKSQFALLLSLTIVVEKIYNLEGIGYLAWEYATQESDLITVAWIVALCFLLVWIFNSLLDICIFFLSVDR